MPRLKIRNKKRSRKDVMIHQLLTGELLPGGLDCFGLTYDPRARQRLQELWDSIPPEVLAEWEKDNPGEVPFFKKTISEKQAILNAQKQK